MLGLLPTGAGKSLTFQFPSIIQNGCTIVVCPITALVRDHVLELENFGFKRRAAFINKDIVGKKREHIHRRLQRGKHNICLYHQNSSKVLPLGALCSLLVKIT